MKAIKKVTQQLKRNHRLEHPLFGSRVTAGEGDEPVPVPEELCGRCGLPRDEDRYIDSCSCGMPTRGL